jgi:O-antigen/teichoic acid export membrane protein
LLASISTALSSGNLGLAHRYIQAGTRFNLVVLMPVAMLGAIDAPVIMELVFSEEYSDGGVYLAWLLGGYCIFSLLDTLIQALIADGRYRQVTIGLIGMIPVAFVINSLLIRAAGAVGAGMAFALTLAAATALVTLSVGFRFGRAFSFATLGRVCVSTAVVAVISTQIEAGIISVLPKLAALMLIYGLLLALLRELGPDDLRPFALWKKP